MPDWPIGSDSTRIARFPTTLTSTQGTLVSVTAAHTKGSWVEIIPSSSGLSFDACGFLFCCHRFYTSQTALFDIGVGPSSNEVVLLPNLLVEGLALRWGQEVFIPLPLSAGTRVAVRAQSSLYITSQVGHVTLGPVGQGFLPSTWPGAVETLGVTASPTVTSGTNIDPGTPPGTTGTKGAWFGLKNSAGVESLTRPCSMLLLMVGTIPTAGYVANRWYIDVGIGAQGAEQVVLPDLLLARAGTIFIAQQLAFGPYPFSFPAGTRISIRAQFFSGTTTLPSRAFNIAAYAFG